MTRRSFLAAASAASLLGADTRPPNVVIIFCDDLGYGDVGCYGAAIPTPNIDSLAREGMRFTQYCNANSVCSPSRSGLLTGRYPTRVGVPDVLFPNSMNGLAKDETTLASALKRKDYKTCCIGKWHLGTQPGYLPTDRGFDEYFGIPYSNDMNPRVLMDGANVIEQEVALDTLTPRYTQRAVQFIERAKGGPFFLYLPHTYPHIPLGASDRFRNKSPLGQYGDVVQELDWSVGEIIAALKRTGTERNTFVIFSSDNGPWFLGSPGRLRGRKGSTLEGGMRVPFIARWPGKIPTGTSDEFISGLDVAPTVAKLAGATLTDKPLDGIDIWPLLSGKTTRLPHEAFLYFQSWQLQCARLGNWKLHISRFNTAAYAPAPAGGTKNYPLTQPELYDLSRDHDESYDVAPQHPEIVRDILARIDRMLPTFPEPVQRAYAETRARQNIEARPGAWPRGAAL